MHDGNILPKRQAPKGVEKEVQDSWETPGAECAPANRATQLEGLKDSPPLLATHLIIDVNFCKGHRNKIEVPDPLAVAC